MGRSLILNPRVPRAATLKALRDQLYQTVYANGAPQNGQTGDPNVARLANAFSRYAGVTQTAFDTGGVQSSSAGGSNLMERQVERAMSQVLGRGLGRSSDSFMSALNSKYPGGSNGTMTVVGAPTGVSMYSPNGSGTITGAGQTAIATQGKIAGGLAGQLSAEQAALHRQASILAADALQVLPTLQPFASIADKPAVEALRSLVDAEMRGLVEEFGRIDRPREDRVSAYFDSLIGPDPTQPSGDLSNFGRRALLDYSMDPTTTADEAQIAGYTLLQNYGNALFLIWQTYQQTQQSPTTPAFSLQIQEASIMLPVLAEANNNFMASMDSIGFDENVRRSVGVTFNTLSLPTLPPGILTTLATYQIGLSLPDITLFDATEWLDRLSNQEGQSSLADSGIFGLDFVTNQADELFRLFATVLLAVKFGGSGGLGGGTLLAQVLSHERVSWALDDLFFQIKTLADLAA